MVPSSHAGFPPGEQTHHCYFLQPCIMNPIKSLLEQVYTVSVSPFFGAEAPSARGQLHGDVSIAFSCDPDNAARLIQMTLAELERLQACHSCWSSLQCLHPTTPSS